MDIWVLRLVLGSLLVAIGVALLIVSWGRRRG